MEQAQPIRSMNQNNLSYIKFDAHKTPEFKELSNKINGEEIVSYGEKNLYPDYLIELYMRSAKHNAIINGKVNYIYGRGLSVDSKSSNYEQKAIAENFFKSVLKPENQRRWILDFELFNAFAIEVIYSKNKKRFELNYIPLSKIRTNKDESKYFYSNDWGATTQNEKTGFKVFDPFDANNPGGTKLFVFKLLSPIKCKEQNVYSVPEYIGGNASIETDIEIANYHLANIKTGFSAGTIINFNNGVPEEEAKEQIEKSIKKKLTGTDRAGSLVLTFNNSSENAPTIESFTPSDLDKQFIEIGKRVEQDIFTAHKITSPMLFGVKTEGQLGGRQEMIDAFELFQTSYVDIRQGYLEDVFNKFANLLGIVNQVKFEKMMPVKSSLPDTLVTQAYTSDEVRELMGLPKLKKEDNYNVNVVNSLNSLNPAILSKVLENMTADEIRALAGLKSGQAQPQPQQMAKQIDFNAIGVSSEDYEILFERDFIGQEDEDCIMEYRKMQFASELTANERAIVDLLGKDPLMPSDGISKVIGIPIDEVNQLISSLNERGFLTGGNKPTKAGETVINKDGAKTVDIEVKYRYDWRSDVPAAKRDINTTRDFCHQLLSANKLYTRLEIDAKDNGQDLPVWDSKGGWWNRDGANVPYCRHIWKQTVVRKK